MQPLCVSARSGLTTTTKKQNEVIPSVVDGQSGYRKNFEQPLAGALWGLASTLVSSVDRLQAPQTRELVMMQQK